VILEALARFNPARALANSGSSSVISVAWSRGRPGQATLQYEIMGAAYGGGPDHDGTTATATHLSNLHIAPIEILESEFPCRVTRFELKPDSGGAGQWRGGLSLQREYELLEDATVIRRFDKARFPPGGLTGGKAGAGGRFVTALGTAHERETPPGRYEMHVFHPSVSPDALHAAEREITVTPGDSFLGTISLAESDLELAHKNKYGRDYDRPDPASPAYARP